MRNESSAALREIQRCSICNPRAILPSGRYEVLSALIETMLRTYTFFLRIETDPPRPYFAVPAPRIGNFRGVSRNDNREASVRYLQGAASRGCACVDEGDE